MSTPNHNFFDLNEEYHEFNLQDEPSLEEINLNDTVHERVQTETAEIVQASDATQGGSTNLFQQTVELFDNDNSEVVNDITNPEVGMVFPGSEEFTAFIYSYAYKRGFELFIRTNEFKEEYKANGISRLSTGEKESRFFMYKRMRMMCKKGGENKHEGSNVTGCKFVVDARFPKGKTMMEITCCELEHNHEIIPENRRFMVNYRVISDYFKRRIMLNDAAGISIVKNYNSMVLECGGHENVPFNNKDVRNLINQERRTVRLGGDATALLKYFEEMKADNPDFFYAIRRNSDGRLSDFFWADARCRALFKAFPMFFHMTLHSCAIVILMKEEWFEMPFSPFVGVNHHGRSTLFAAALISRENTETFEWVFRQWLECMGKPPSIILTDQATAIGNAIKSVFGIDFPHRLCLWHIMRNAAKNLGACAGWPKIEVELRNAVHDTMDANEFEEAWRTMVQKYQIQNNPWIKESYALRRKWVPVYWKGTFCAGMSSTQRSEQQNRFLKTFVSIESGLCNFVHQFKNAILSKVNEEKQMNFECLDRPPKLSPGSILVEEVFHKLYTNTMFKEVQAEVFGLFNTNVVNIGKVGNYTRYLADEIIVDPPWRRGAKKSYEVNIDAVEVDFTCSCKLFEFKGILCKHIIRCIQLEDIKYIPDKYILDCWRKDIVRGYEHIRVGYYDPEAYARVKKSMKMNEKNDYIARLALQDDEAYAIYEAGIADLSKKLENHVGVDTISSSGTGGNSSKVWGRRRLQRKENNQRHIIKNLPPPVEGCIKDPVDKRGVGRARKPKQKTFRKRSDGSSQPTPSKRSEHQHLI
ncbi:protein FAR1-RELATED SEQUENCE 5-like [Silene latifolia]|uniref:protein FAR1-RELATED SEQUENCE 5-like n=1 Tax=Silene latifolia TaxID=37657 RepID=UPI003D774EA2